MNGKVERSHRVDQQECYQLLDKDGISDDVHLFNEKLREWEDYYNYHRPHGALSGQTRTTRHAGYAVSQRKRKLVEQAFGWMKTVGGLRKLHHRGGPLVARIFTFTAAVYNIMRMRRLLGATA